MANSWETRDVPRRISAGRVTDYRLENNKAFINFERGRARIESYGEGILRITLTTGDFSDSESLP